MSRPRIVCPTVSDNDGAYALHWSGASDVTWRLEENGVALYEGPDGATTVTGRPEGIYEYRVGVVHDGTVATFSAPCSVEVAPPSLALALSLAAVGALVFAAVLALVITGDRATRSQVTR